MKLNLDCVRDILLTLEEITDGVIQYDISESNYKKYTSKYSYKEYAYHLRQCIDSGLIKGKYDANFVYFQDITPKAHNFLANVREDNLWSKFKENAPKFGCLSINTLISKASEYFFQLFLDYLKK